MKRTLNLFFIFLILISPAFGQVNKSEMMRGAKLSEPKASTPTVVIGANELAKNMAEPGWPIIVSAAMLSEDGSTVSVPNNLQIKMINEKSGQGVQVNFEAVSAEGKEETRFWIASESETNNLTPGNYIVTVQPIERIVIQPADLVVTERNPDNAAALNDLKIQKFLLLGKDDDALAEADRQVNADAENVNAWVAKGDILMGKDLPDEALKAYEKALEIAEKTDDEPLFIQERHRAAFFRSLEKRGIIKTEDNQP